MEAGFHAATVAGAGSTAYACGPHRRRQGGGLEGV